MGLYNQDPNFEETFKVGDRFVLTGMEYNGTINTRMGTAERVTLSIVTRDSYPRVVKFSALGVGFAMLAKRATPADFPHVAEYIQVPLPGNKKVKRFAPVMDEDSQPLDPKAWVEGHDGIPINMDDYQAQGQPDQAAPGNTGDMAGF